MGEEGTPLVMEEEILEEEEAPLILEEEILEEEESVEEIVEDEASLEEEDLVGATSGTLANGPSWLIERRERVSFLPY